MGLYCRTWIGPRGERHDQPSDGLPQMRNFRSAHELAPVRLRGRTQEFDQLGDDHFRRWAVVLTCEHAALGVR